MLQIFKPVEVQINDNLLKNSVALPGKIHNDDDPKIYDSWILFSGTFDNSKYPEFNSIKSKLDTTSSYVNVAINSKYKNPPGNNAVVFSCYCEITAGYISDVTGWVYVSVQYKDGTDGTLTRSDIVRNHISGNLYRLSWYFPSVYAPSAVSLCLDMFHVSQDNASQSNIGTLWISRPKLEYGTLLTPYCPSIYENIEWDYDQYNASYQSQKIGDIPNIISYDYTKSLTAVGSFSMSINAKQTFANEIKENTLLYYGGDWLIAQNVKRENDTLYIEGYDGKGLLSQRITLYDIQQDTGTMGYDVATGSTELCLKHYIVNNIVNPIDSNRVIPTFTIAENKDRGIANDTYISRFELLNELAEKICKNANIGYDVTVDLLSNKMIFDIVDITDKTINQRDRNQIVFSLDRHNIAKLVRETGVTNYKNAFYATKSGGTLEADATTILTKRSEDTEYSKGIYRREMQLNVSCENVSDINTFAQQQMPQYLQTDSFTIEIANPYEYGKLFFIGDKVTIISKELNIQLDTIINGAKVTKSNGSYSVALIFGETKPKPFKTINITINNKGV